MNVIKKIMLPAMLGLVASGLTASLVHATALSDLQSQCLICHDVTVSPSNWVLSMNAIGTPAGQRPAQKTLAGWQTTIAAMGGKCGFSNVGPGGTSQAVAAQFLYGMQPLVTSTITPPPSPSPICTPPPSPWPTLMCPNEWVSGAPWGTCFHYNGCPTYTPTFTATPTGTTSPTPTFTVTPTATPSCPTPTPLVLPPGLQCSQWLLTGTNGCAYYVGECQTPTATFTPTPTTVVSPTPTSTGPHTWYDYDYLGGRCFQKDHTIMDKLWCEQHGLKGGGSHPSLTGYQRHAHLDSPGQKP